MNKSKFEEAKKRLGLKSKKPAETEEKRTVAERQTQANELTPQQTAAAEFMQGVKRSDETYIYTCFTEDFLGKKVEYRPLKPGDVLVMEESALSIKLTEIGYDPKNLRDADLNNAIASIPKMDSIDVAINGARGVVVQAAICPMFSHLPSDRCPDNKVPVEELPVEEVLALSTEIKKRSGVEAAEDRFRTTDKESAVESDAGEPERSADDSDAKPETDSAE